MRYNLSDIMFYKVTHCADQDGMKTLIAAVSFITFIMCCPAYGQGDQFLQQHEERRLEMPQDISCELRLASKTHSFHQGEMIPIELGISSSTPDRYEHDGADYDRSGRLSIDSFVVDRKSDAVDPLDDYFNRGYALFQSGGLRYFGALVQQPYISYYDVNEWLQFDKPGKYRLFISSGRVSVGERTGQEHKGFPVISNIIEFEIAPADENWSQTKLKTLERSLDSPLSAKDHKAACRELRFLTTELAAKEIIRRFTGQDEVCQFEFFMALQGSPHRKLVIDEMTLAMNKSDFPVTRDFVEDLWLLSYFYQTAGSFKKDLGGAAGNDDADWDTIFDLKGKQIESEKVANNLEAALKNKTGQALAISTATLNYIRKLDKDR